MPISDLLAQISGEKQSSVPLPSPAPKRKADGGVQRMADKLVRQDQPVPGPATTVAQVKKSEGSDTAGARLKPGAAVSSNARVNVLTSSNGTIAATAASPGPEKPPKKGSYAEILARAKAAQATHGNVGKIQHKPIEKGPTKRERQELKERGSQSYRVSKRPSKLGVRSHAGSVQNGARETSGKGSSKVKVPAIPKKKIKKAALATTGYTGTARPNPAANKSLKSATPSRVMKKTGHGRSSSSRHNSYASEDGDGDGDEDEDEEMEEEENYSDASSDMEADMFEVDAEEKKAARIAQKEDDAALQEELKHQREKAEKRRRLADLAKARR